jgi:hypothetical protein
MALSQMQKDILTGLLLGDGNLEFNKFKGSRLQIKQAERKKEYVFWLYEHFAQIVRTPPQKRFDTNQWYFATRSISELEEIRNIFYVNNRKIVPQNIQTFLTSPLSLAIWFMDDGTLDYRAKSHHSFTYSTDAFSVEEVFLLQKSLKENFNISCSI